MARYDRDGGRVPTDLFETAAWRYSVVARCRRCRHEAAFDPHAVWWLFERKGWDNHFSAVARRLMCGNCGRRGAQLSWAKGKAVTVILAMPSLRDWKRAISRFRS